VIAPRASVVLMTKNGAATLPSLLDAIARQQFDGTVETIAVDSSSTDGTERILRERVDQLITIEPESFDHGLTRNLGIERARSEAVVLIVQDALPASATWLRELTAPLDADPRIAGTFARQVPRPDCRPLTRHYANRWYAASPTPRVATIETTHAFEALSPSARFERCVFDNVCSCIRRSVWARHPFNAATFAEDLEWARTVLLSGYALAYAPGAVVTHSHDRSTRYEFARTRILHQRLYTLFGMRTIPTVADLARSTLSCLVRHVSIEPRPRALALAFAWPLAQYLGGRDGARAAAR
jgi:glycosyltransferase involved in cell wall biosynthesis